MQARQERERGGQRCYNGSFQVGPLFREHSMGSPKKVTQTKPATAPKIHDIYGNLKQGDKNRELNLNLKEIVHLGVRLLKCFAERMKYFTKGTRTQLVL